MRILNLVTGEKWTGTAAVVFDQTAALVAAGIEAQFGFVADSPLSRRLHPLGWARPILSGSRRLLDPARDVDRLRALLARERFDVVHAHATHDHVVASLAVRATGARLARTLHHVRQARRDPISRALFRRTDGVAFANRAIASRLHARGPVHSPVIDPARFTPDGNRAAPPGVPGPEEKRFVIGTVGKLAAGRGHEETIRALASLPAEAVLLHVGKGEHRPALEALAASLSLAARNAWAGYQEEELPALYRTMDVFLFAASGSDQGQRAILEAMASGLPVVALDIPGVRDLVTEGEQGFVAKDLEGIARGLRTLAADAELRVRLGRRARLRALEHAPENFAPVAREFYEGLFTQAGRREPAARARQS